jgi:hypothetical protein
MRSRELISYWVIMRCDISSRFAKLSVSNIEYGLSVMINKCYKFHFAIV